MPKLIKASKRYLCYKTLCRTTRYRLL